MITCKVQPSAKLASQSFSSAEEDLPPSTWTLFDVPRIGEEVEDPATGRNFTVVRVCWWTDGSEPLLIVE